MTRPYFLAMAILAIVSSVTGAAISISGLAKLFAGAPVAVMIMAGALELAKVVSATFLRSNWKKLHPLMRMYMSIAIVILMGITSLGIFGYVSHTFQNASSELRMATNGLRFYNAEDLKVQEEMARLQHELSQIPESRAQMRASLLREIVPRLEQLKRKSIELQILMRQEHAKKVTHQAEIGPVIWVSEFFNKEVDRVATWFIVLFVFIFEPLAMFFVIAATAAVQSGRGLKPSETPASHAPAA